MSRENLDKCGIKLYDPNSTRDSLPTLKELVQQDALGQTGQFTAQEVASRLGADKFRVMGYLDFFARTGQIARREVVARSKKSSKTFYGPAKPVQERLAS